MTRDEESKSDLHGTFLTVAGSLAATGLGSLA
jgi:hypothetical protein